MKWLWSMFCRYIKAKWTGWVTRKVEGAEKARYYQPEPLATDRRAFSDINATKHANKNAGSPLR